MPFSATNQGYDEFSLVADYVADMKRLSIPVAGPPGTPCVVIQTAAPVGSKVVTFAFQRFGQQPQVPSMNPVNSNEVIKSFHVKVYAPWLQAEGQQHTFRVEGAYVYDLLVPLGPANPFPAPVPPYDTNPIAGAGINPTDYSTTMIPGEVAKPAPLPLNLIKAPGS